MHLSFLVVSQRILLNTLCNFLIGNLNVFILTFCFNNQFKDVQEFPCITSGIAEDGTCFLDLNMFFTEEIVFRNGVVKEFK